MSSHFIWYELLTSDPDAAADFYGKVIGWQTQDSGQAGMDYRIFTMNDVPVCGLMKTPAEAAASGMPPVWFGYLSVPEVDACVAAAVAAGGESCMPAMDVPGATRPMPVQ